MIDCHKGLSRLAAIQSMQSDGHAIGVIAVCCRDLARNHGGNDDEGPKPYPKANKES